MKPKDFDGLIRRSLEIDVKAIDESKRSVDVIASTTTIDSHGDEIEQTWNLARYRKNPTVLYGHNRTYSDDQKATLPIGTASNVRVEDGMLLATLTFGTASYLEFCETIWQGFLQKILRAVSVGFRPGKVETVEDDKTGRKRYILKKNTLYEISVVPIGSNPDAIAVKSLVDDSKIITLDQAERQYLQLRSLESDSETIEKTPEVNPPPSQVEANDMDPKTNPDLQTRYDDLQRRSAVIESENGRFKAEAELSATKIETLTKSLDATKADLAKAEAETIQFKSELETEQKAHSETKSNLTKISKLYATTKIESYVGKKIYKSELDDFAEDVEKYGMEKTIARIERRPDLNLTSEVVKEDPKDKVNRAAGDGPNLVDEILAEVDAKSES